MSKVFISYARDDEEAVDGLHEELRAAGVSVWRDQESLRLGERWPKALGEAIAEQDYFVLCWSAAAATSDFVELEWVTALALEKPILPLLLDDTPLPPSLRGINGKPFEGAVGAVLTALGAPTLVPTAGRREQVVRKLEALPATEPEKVLEAVKTVFSQEGWVVHGDVTIIVHPPLPVRKNGEAWTKRWAARLALITAILTLLTAGLELTGQIDLFSAKDPEVKTYSLAGTITVYGESTTLEGVIISFTYAGRVQRDTTDSDGHYAFVLRATEPPTVSLRAEREGFITHTSDPALPNDKQDFQMKRQEADVRNDSLEVRSYIISGDVSNEDGEPIEGVVVRLTNVENDPVGITDEIGKFEIRITASGQVSIGLLAQKEGYETYRRRSVLIRGNWELDFIMRRDE